MQYVLVHVSIKSCPHAEFAALNVENTVPLIRHPPDPPFVKVKGLDSADPQNTVISPPLGANTGGAAGKTVIVLVTGVSNLPQLSVALHVCITVPPHAVIDEYVDKFDVPLISHPPLNPLLNGNVLAAGNPPQATVIAPGAVIVGSAAGDTVINLETDTNALPHESVAVHVSVTIPPQAPGVAENVD